MNFKLDYDEGVWLLTIDGHETTITVHMDDSEAFALNAVLADIRRRQDEYEDHKQLYKGMELAGMGYAELDDE